MAEIDVSSLKSNSYKSKETVKKEPKKSVVSKKPTLMEKPKEKGFLKSETAQKVKSYVLQDVILPGAKELLWSIVTGGVSMILFGEARKSLGGRSGPSERISYWNGINGESSKATMTSQPSSRIVTDFDIDRIRFTSKADAEMVLDSMEEILSRWGVVKVSDFYELSEMSTDNYLINDYGWDSIRGADVFAVPGGFVIKMPKARPIRSFKQ